MSFTPALRKFLALITLFSTCPLYGSNPLLLLEEHWDHSSQMSPSLRKIDELIEFVKGISVCLTNSILSAQESPKLEEEIDAAFKIISARIIGQQIIGQQDCWTHFGDKQYFSSLSGSYFNEHKLILSELRKIKSTQGKKDDIWIMDVGSGRTTWAEELAFKASNDQSIKDIRINILNLSGEPFKEPAIEEEKKYKIYRFGEFKIEDLKKQLLIRKIPENVRFLAIVSRWTYGHLVAPVKPFLQAYSLLQPNGLMIIDSFEFLTEESLSFAQKRSTEKFRPLFSLLYDMQAPFIAIPHDYHGMTNGPPFIIKAGGKIPDQKMLSYSQNDLSSEKSLRGFKAAVYKYRINLPDSFYKQEAIIAGFFMPAIKSEKINVVTTDGSFLEDLKERGIFRNGINSYVLWKLNKLS